jgi:hypothetical protein
MTWLFPAPAYTSEPMPPPFPELISLADFVGIVAVTEAKPMSSETGEHPTLGEPKVVKFKWVEKWRQSPYLPAEEIPIDGRLVAHYVTGGIRVGRHLAFLRYEGQGEYRGAEPGYALFPIIGDEVYWLARLMALPAPKDRPGLASVQPPLFLVEGEWYPAAIISVEAAKAIVEACVLDDQDTVFYPAEDEDLRLDAPVRGGRYQRLMFYTEKGPTPWWPPPLGRAYRIVGHVEVAVVTDRIRRILSSGETQLRVSGRWTRGWFVITQLTDQTTKEDLLSEDKGDKSNY